MYQNLFFFYKNNIDKLLYYYPVLPRVEILLIVDIFKLFCGNSAIIIHHHLYKCIQLYRVYMRLKDR